MTITGLESIRTIEAANPDPTRELGSTYEMIREGASIDPSAPALSFFLRTEDFASPVVWSHAELLQDITRAAHLFRRLGVRRCRSARPYSA